MPWVTLANTEPIPGAAVWTSAGVSGLLSLIIGWLLLKHIPTLMEEQKAERKAYQESLKQMADKNDADRAAFHAALNVVLEHCKEDMNRVVTAFRDDTTRVIGALQSELAVVKETLRRERNKPDRV